MCPCQGDGHHLPALPLSLWSLSPVLQLQLDFTKAKADKLYFWKSMHWAAPRELWCVLSPVKLPENPLVVPFVSLGLPTLSADYCFFATKRPWWQNKFSHAKLWELTGGEQSFNFPLILQSWFSAVCFRLCSFNLYCFSAGKLAGCKISVRRIFGLLKNAWRTLLSLLAPMAVKREHSLIW